WINAAKSSRFAMRHTLTHSAAPPSSSNILARYRRHVVPFCCTLKTTRASLYSNVTRDAGIREKNAALLVHYNGRLRAEISCPFSKFVHVGQKELVGGR